MRDKPLLCAVPQMGPFFSRQALPLDLWHASAAENQSAELIDEAILLFRIVVDKILLEPLEKLTLAILLALQAEAYEDCYGLTNAHINLHGVLLHPARD